VSPNSWFAATGAAVATLWVAALIAVPRRPRFGDETTYRVYARMLGRQPVLIALAVVVTIVAGCAAVISARPNRIDATLRSVRPVCRPLADGRQLCLIERADGEAFTVVLPGGHT
jgi:hypothetical protein